MGIVGEHDINPEDNIPDKDERLVKRIQRHYRESMDEHDEWRKEVKRYFDYIAARQWDEDELDILEDEERPPVTFNRMEIFVQAICGLESLNRHEVRFLPRRTETQPGALSDLYTGAAKYVNDDSDAEVHHSSAFRDLVIAGMGWTERYMDFELNPDGDIRLRHCDPLRMAWDTRATERNIQDTRWRMRLFPLSLEEVLEQWPEKADQVRYANLFNPDSTKGKGVEHEPYDMMDSGRVPKEEDDVWIGQYQWFERVKHYRVIEDGEVKNLDATAYAVRGSKGGMPYYKRLFKQAFVCGNVLLEQQDLVTEDFTLQCMTGKFDRNRNEWYGICRALKDPQDWLNKLFSQILHIINSNSKGGLLAELGAFDSQQQAEAEWARPNGIVWVNEGGLERVKEKQMIQYPAGLDRLLQFALSMFQDVTGANLELLGLSSRNQPGVLEAQRKQAGMTLLAWAFDAMRAYRKTDGRVLATLIREFISDGRMIRISGEDGQQYIPLMRDELAFEYDILVDESPSSVNEKERTFLVLMELVPVLIKSGIALPAEFIDYLPLPTVLIEKWKAQIKPDEQQQQMQQFTQQLAIAKEQAEVEETKSKAALNKAKAVSEAIGD